MTEPTIEGIAEKAATEWYTGVSTIKEVVIAAIREATEAQRKEIERLEAIEGQLSLQIGALERSNQALRGINTSRKDENERLKAEIKELGELLNPVGLYCTCEDCIETGGYYPWCKKCGRKVM